MTQRGSIGTWGGRRTKPLGMRDVGGGQDIGAARAEEMLLLYILIDQPPA
jgi:hypothetical protein